MERPEIMTMNPAVLPEVRLAASVNCKYPWRQFPRVPDEYILYALKSGEMFIKEGNTQYHLKNNDMLLLEPGLLHCGFKDSCCRYYYIHFRHPELLHIKDKDYADIMRDMRCQHRRFLSFDTYSGDKPQSVCHFPKCFRYADKTGLTGIIETLREDFLMKNDNFNYLTAFKTSELFIKIGREFTSSLIDGHYSKTYAKVESVIDYLNRSYTLKISGADVAKHCEGNFDYLNRVFHAATGMPIFKYLNTIRINMAKRLIMTTNLSFSEIAYLVGINDPYYFSREFKKYAGITPTQYLKQSRKL